MEAREGQQDVLGSPCPTLHMGGYEFSNGGIRIKLRNNNLYNFSAEKDGRLSGCLNCIDEDSAAQRGPATRSGLCSA